MEMGYYKKYGPVFGAWSIIREVGSCSIGKVFELRRNENGKIQRETLIAASVVQSDGISGCRADQLQLSSFTDRAKAELELMKKLDAESGILGCKEYQIIPREGGWDILIRTELVTPLPVYANERSLSQEEVAKLGVDICKALELCAKHNIVHGGITPDNIFVSASGEYKLGDLGLGASVGSSIEYTAPEVIKGEIPDLRADLYSLGLVMYQHLNNSGQSLILRSSLSDDIAALETAYMRMKAEIIPRVANGDEDLEMMALKICKLFRGLVNKENMARKPISAPENNGERLAAAVLKACAFTPKERYISATKMREALERAEWRVVVTAISAGEYHTVYLKSNGTVVAEGSDDYRRCKVDSWTDIIAVSAGSTHTVGLKSDGSVIAIGSDEVGQCDVNAWQDIIAISAGREHTVGLKFDGTVVAVGNKSKGQCDVEAWTGITALSAGALHTVGLKSDGTVIAVGNNYYGQCDVDTWKDITAVSAGDFHTVGLKADGTVVAVGYNGYDQCKVGWWKNVVAVSAGKSHTVGLKADGTVVVAGSKWRQQRQVYTWTDIIAVSAGREHTVGLKRDGTIVATGDNSYGQCKVNELK